MKTKVFIPTSTRPDDFIFIYNGKPIKISKYLFALYSQKFRRIPEFYSTNQMEITDDPPFNVFNQFLRAAQGAEVNVTIENAIDFLHFCDVWEVASVAEEVKRVINENHDIQTAVLKYLDSKETDSLYHLEDIIASNFDVALQMSSLTEFPIESLHRIISNPKCEIKKASRYYHFFKKMLKRIGPNASLLAQKIDLDRLSLEELTEFLKLPNLNKSFISETLSDITIQVIEENVKLIRQINEDKSFIQKISTRLDTLEVTIQNDIQKNDTIELMKQLKKKIATIEQEIGSGNHKVGDQNDSKLETIYNQAIEKMTQRYEEVESKAHRDLRKTNKIVNGLTKKSSVIESNLASIHTMNIDTKNALLALMKKIIECEDTLKSFEYSQMAKSLETQQCVKYDGQPDNGILYYLTKEANVDNIHHSGIVNISASTTDHNEVYNMLDPGWDDCFFTEDKPESWIMIDFLNKMVSITNYTIRTHKYKSGTCHIKSWLLEGSADGNTWIDIDKRSTPILNGPKRVQTFPAAFSDEIHKFRFVRLKQIGCNCNGSNILALTSIELFGSIYS